MATEVHGVYHDGAVVAATTVVFFTLTLVTYCLRMWVRLTKHSVGIDDICASFCFCFLTGLSTLHVMNSTNFGHIGADLVDYTPQQIQRFMLGVFVDNLFYFCTSATVKLSVILLYRRIFVSHNFRMVTNVMMAIVTAWWIGFMVAQICSCLPVDASWIPAKQATAKCINTAKFYNGVTISNVILDWIILVMPLYQIWHLQMNVRRKLQVSALFAAGIFTCVCSILRTYFLITLNYTNFTVTIWKPALWTTIEPCVGLMCANLPVAAGLFRIWRQNLRSYYNSLFSRHNKSGMESAQSGSSNKPAEKDGRFVRSIGGTMHFLPKPAGSGSPRVAPPPPLPESESGSNSIEEKRSNRSIV